MKSRAIIVIFYVRLLLVGWRSFVGDQLTCLVSSLDYRYKGENRPRNRLVIS